MRLTHSSKRLVSLLFTLTVASQTFALPLPLIIDQEGKPIASYSRSICGKNDMAAMTDQNDDLKKMGTPIGIFKLRLGNLTGKCTGTLISKDLFLTAKHCEGPCNEISVTFGFLQGGRVEETFSCKEIVEKGNEDYNNDYMIVQLEGSPGVRWGWYEPSAREIPHGQELLMIHHPSGTPMKVSSQNCKVIQCKDGLVEHQCDTEPGSSGSAIFLPDYKTPEKTRIIGVHTLGGCNPTETLYNRGPAMTNLVKHSAILKELAKD